MQAIILAGGFGTRLKSVVADVPKPMAPIGGRPFLAWLIESMAAQGISGVTISAYHQWEKICDYFEQNPLPVPVRCAVEPEPLGTGGAIAYALQQSSFKEPVIVVNGDTFVSLDYRALYRQHCKNKARLTMALRQVPDSGRYGAITVEDGVITAFGEGHAGQPGLINAGVYVLTPELFTGFSMPEVFSFERDFLPQYLHELAPRSYIADDYFIDIGVPEDYARAQQEIPELLYAKA